MCSRVVAPMRSGAGDDPAPHRPLRARPLILAPPWRRVRHAMTLPLASKQARAFVPRPYQVTARERVEAAWASGTTAPLIVMATGCHPAGTAVLMWDGAIKPVEDVVVGDLLMGPDSSPRRVLQLARGEDEIWEVVPTKGERWRINPDHILTLHRTAADPEGPPSKRAALVDVSAREWMGWSTTRKHRHKIVRTGVDFPEQAGCPIPISPWLLGVLLGDGSIPPRGGAIRITSADAEIREAVLDVARAAGWQAREVTYSQRCPEVQVLGVHQSLRALGLVGRTSGDKFVPRRYLVGSRAERLDVLAGLIDTDGHLACNGYDFISKSHGLAADVAFLARSLGLAAYVSETQRTAQTGGGGTYFRVSISGDTSMVPCRLARKLAAPRTQKKNPLVTGFTIRPCGHREPYYGFALDGDCRYLLGDFTVTHNTGKTKTALYIAESVRGRVVWLAHRQELLDQPLSELWWGTDSAGVVQADRDASDARIVFASVQTLAQPERLAALLRAGHPELLVVDEAHHSVSPSYRAVIEQLRGPRTRLLGLTATADREDDRDLGELWTVAYSLGIVEAVEQGYLVPPYAAVVRPPDFDEHQADARRDYEDAVGELLLAAGVVEHTVAVLGQAHLADRLPRRDDTQRISARDRSWLVFTATVEQARLTAEALLADGWRAAWVSGETPKRERQRLARAFAKGEINALCNAGVFTEGTDLPRCNGILLARATASWSLFVQMIGRGLRLNDPRWDPSWGPMTRIDERYRGDQDCLVIDLAGATELHSLVAAPALVGGTRCKGPGGQHVLEPREGGKGGCKHCSLSIPCWTSHEAGGDGQHTWVDKPAVRECSHCGRPQCVGAPDGRHGWIPQPGWQYACMHPACGATRPMPLSSLQGDRRGPGEPPPPAAWVALHQLDRPVEALDLGEHGLLFLAEADRRCRPWWLPSRARQARPLTDAPVDRWYALELCADLVRKAKKAWDPWRRETLFGGTDGQIGDVVELRRRATARAVAAGVASWR